MPRKITICLLLTWVVIPLCLTVLSGDLQQFQWLLLATLSGALSQAIAIVFGGTVSCDKPSNVQSSGTDAERDAEWNDDKQIS